MARLFYSDRSGSTELELEPSKGSYIIGRSAGVDVQLHVTGVSRKHAELRYDPAVSGWTIKDLGSSNGTWINGRRVPAAALAHGDQFLIGELQILFDDSRPVRQAGPPPVPAGGPPVPPRRTAAVTPADATRSDFVASTAAAGIAEELEQARNALLEWRARHDDAVAACAELPRLRQQIQDLQAALAEAQAESDRSLVSSAALESLRSRLREANTEIENQRSREDALLKERSELAQRLLHLEQTLQKQAAQIDEFNKQSEATDVRQTGPQALMRRAGPVEAVEIDALKRRVAELTAVQDSLRAERDELMEQVGELQVDRSKAQMRAKELETAASQADALAAGNVAEELAEARTRLESVVADRDQLATQVRSLRATIDAMPDPRTLVSINERLAHAEQELSRRPLPEQLEQAEARYAQLTAELQAARQAESTLQQQLARAVAALRDVRNGGQGTTRALAELRDEVADRVARLLDSSRQTDWPLPDLIEELERHVVDTVEGE